MQLVLACSASTKKYHKFKKGQAGGGRDCLVFFTVAKLV